MNVNILLPDEYKQKLQAIADRETFGNVTMLVRIALANQYPTLKPLATVVRKKRGNGKGEGRE